MPTSRLLSERVLFEIGGPIACAIITRPEARNEKTLDMYEAFVACVNASMPTKPSARSC